MNTHHRPNHAGCPVDYFAPSRGMSGAQSPTGCPISHEAAEFDPFGDRFQIDPAEALKWFRNREPVFYSPKLGYWVVTRYNDMKEIWRDYPTYASTNVMDPMRPMCAEAQEVLKRYDFAMTRTLINESEPMRMHRRRLLKESFDPQRLAEDLPFVRRQTTRFVDRFIDRGHADLVKEMLWELPLVVALNFLGVDEDDIARLRQFSVAHAVRIWGLPTDEEQIEVAENLGKFWQLSQDILSRLRQDPDGPGWMRLHVRLNQDHPEIITDAYLSSMMLAVVGAAHETTANSISNAMRLLLTDGTAWKQVCENPLLIPNAMEECLRFEGAIVAWRRITTREVTLGGVRIPAQANLLVVTVAGNRDDSHFENPDDFDIYRDNTTDHFTFGYGAHQCLGKNIGRMEMAVIGEELARRLPHMELAEGHEFTFSRNLSFRGPESLPVRWDPARNPERRDPNILTRRMEFPVGAPVRAHVQRPVRVVSAQSDGSEVLRVTLEDANGRALPAWRPGAHVELLLDGFERKYSLCGTPGGHYELAIQRVPDGRGGSAHFHDRLREGAILGMRGPKTHFLLDEDAPHYLLIAGGIGITPILAMADRLRALGKPYALHYAGRSRAAMALLDRVEADHAAALTLYPGDNGARMDLAAITRGQPTGTLVYVCGPDRMLDALAELAQDWPEGRLQFEAFTAALALDPEKEHAFEVELTDSRMTLTVPRDRTLLDVLLEAGIDVQHDCREGLCGNCECSVVDGQIDHRDRVLTPQERAEGKKMLVCCSRAQGAKMQLEL